MSPVEMSFLSSLVEVEVGHSLYLPLQVLGKTPEEPPLTLPFYDCRFMGFKFSLADDAIFNVSLDQNISKRGRGEMIKWDCIIVIGDKFGKWEGTTD